MTATAPLRPDGKCLVCLKPRHPERSEKYAGRVAETDSFCSTECCRKWHGCSLPPVTKGRPVYHLEEEAA